MSQPWRLRRAWVSAERPKDSREGWGMGVSVGVGDGESVNVGDGRVGWLPSTVNRPPSACGLRSGVCGRHEARKRLRIRNKMMNRRERGMGGLRGAFL
jgi:hypothetical protein